jgi:dipeptidyl aminopeptidase/acylaminoacyl peptidase
MAEMKIARYGEWKSPITSDLIVAQAVGLSEIRLDSGNVYWLESRPSEGGRSVVVDANGRDLVDRRLNIRTRVHEYGGGAWTISAGSLWFANYADQRLYRLNHDAAEPVAITPEGPWRYADGVIDPRTGAWIGVREDHSAGGHEPDNAIVRIGTKTEVVAQGHDFFSSPRLSPDGSRLAWLAWDHPRMPWDGTTLYIDGNAIAGGPRESVFQPEWSPDGTELFFISDRTGWWNLYRYSLADGITRPLAPLEAEFGLPQWVFGLSTYAFAGPGKLVCTFTSRGLGRLAVIDLASGRLKELPLPFADYSSIRAFGDQVVFRAGSAQSTACFVQLNLAGGQFEILKKSTTVADDPAITRYFTGVQPIEYPTTGNRSAFALYYPAFNPDYQPPDRERPPLLVKCHGGPTSAASSTLDLRTQYWTSRGIAVLDVNYGGSSGFGREYRERLNGNWGIVDVDDCLNGARYLAGQGLVDGPRCVITGGSAGGYTVLAALTFHDFFQGGASYYGISDLSVLARDTHKFESRYLDNLVGPYPEREDLYCARSPIHFVEQLSVPVIFFQGDEDQVVPPNQAEMMVAALRKKGTPVGYLVFSGEQHGFRKAENIKRALDAELYFYAANVFRTGLAF